MTVQRRIRRVAPPSPEVEAAAQATGPTRLEVGAPARQFILPLEALNIEHLGVGELLTAAEVLNTDLEGVAALMRSRGVARARFLVALAWVIARRAEPELTWDEAQRWRIEVEVEARPDPTAGAPPSVAPDG